MKSPNLEGWDEENVSYYCRVLCNQLERWAGMVRVEDVLRYDRHIYEYTLQINEYRQDKVIWKYFQWLELLFTEVYLDKYFSDREGLVKDINRFRKNDFLQNNVQQFTTETDKTIEGIKALLRGEDGLVDAEGYSIYKDAFAYLRELNMDASKVYGDMMTSIFNSSLYGVQLHLDRIAGVDGEIGMRMGNSSYFGVINVGNPADVVKACPQPA